MEKKNSLWKEIHVAYQLMRYSKDYKLNVIVGLVMLVFGMLMTLTVSGFNFLVLVMYYIMFPIFITQLLYAMNASDLIKSCKSARHFQVEVPIIVNVVTTLLSYSILVVCLVLAGYVHLVPLEVQMSLGLMDKRYEALLVFGVYAFMYLVFYGFVWKKYVISTIVFLVTCIPLYIVMMVKFVKGIRGTSSTSSTLPVPVLIVAGYVLILAGGALCYLFSNLMYRRAYSKYAFRGITEEK